jgi:hypothetical protein
MTLLLALALTAGVLLAAGVALWIVFLLLKEQARLHRALDVVMLQVTLPKDLEAKEKEEGIGDDTKERIGIAEQWLSTLAYLPTSWWDKLLYGAPALVLEIVARNDDQIVFYVGCERRYIDHLEKQIYAHYPDAEVTAGGADYTIFEEGDAVQLGTVKLEHAGHLPIATYKELGVDPMQALTGALAKIQKRDAALIQYIVQPASHETRAKGKKAAQRTMQGKQEDIAIKAGIVEKAGETFTDKDKLKEKQAERRSLTPRSQQRVELVEAKSSGQLFAVTIRVAVAARQAEEAERILTSIGGALGSMIYQT